MKKIMAILTALMLVLPFTGVNAATRVNGSVREYQVGDEINFYRSAAEKATGSTQAGQSTIVIDTEKVDGKYIKVLAVAPFVTSDLYFDENIEDAPTATVRKNHISHIEQISEYPWESAKDLTSTLTYISLEEVKSAFGATYDQTTDTYVIDATKWGEILSTAAFGSKGFYTSTYDIENNYVWAVTFEYDSTDIATANVNGIVVKKVAMDKSEYAYVPVVYFDETYDCHYVETTENYACYSCGEDYTWIEVGKQAETCTLVEKAKTKKDCIKTIPTGVEEYILEFVGIVAICVVALVIVKRKELFRGI